MSRTWLLRRIAEVHGGLVHRRRARVLASLVAPFLPSDGEVLDVGCGDGLVDLLLSRARPDLRLRGIDVFPRPGAHIEVLPFSGNEIPCPSKSTDAVLFVDVLHHAADPQALLTEASRVARQCVVIKDHVFRNGFEERLLALMDWVGNRAHGVALPYTYWTREQWEQAFHRASLSPLTCRRRLGLYPFPFRLLFEGSLHFLCCLQVE